MNTSSVPQPTPNWEKYLVDAPLQSTAVPARSDKRKVDESADELKIQLGLYLRKMSDGVVRDDGGGGYPADFVLYQLIEHEIKQLSELCLPEYWNVAIMWITGFTVEASSIAASKTPKKAKKAIAARLKFLKDILREKIEDATLDRANMAAQPQSKPHGRSSAGRLGRHG